MGTSYDVSIIIPFLNEEENIERLGIELIKLTELNPEISYEFLLVNDGSTDKSIPTIKSAKFPLNTKVICLSQNFGSHAALRAGVMHAEGSFTTFLYADLQDPIEIIPAMFEKTIVGNEIIWAFRKNTDNSFFEKKFSKFYSSLMRKYVNKQYPEKGFDVVLFSKKVADLLNKDIEANSSIFLQILNMGFKHDFIEYQKKQRKAGKSKWTISKKIKLLIDSFVSFSYVPIRFVSIIGILFFIVGFGWSFYIVVRKIFFNDLATGWPALISILMIGFGLTNISLGIIAEYLWRTLDASRKRPVFIIDEIIELNNE